MYNTIMAPLDGSELAECVLRHVEAIATGCKTKEVLLLRVVEPEKIQQSADYLIDPELLARRERERIKAAENYLGNVAEKLAKVGLSCKTKCILGQVAESLIDHCSHDSIDLILIATHGRSGVTRWVMGSVAEKIVRSSTTPVMMIRAPGTENGI